MGQLASLAPKVKLPVLILLAAWLGYMVMVTPEATKVVLGDGASTMMVPRSLEGWTLTPGQGDMLATGKTLLGLMYVQVEKTNLPVGGDLAAYITARHDTWWKAEHDYQVRLKGEIRPFGANRVPTARAVYDGKLLGFKVRLVQHDAYLRSSWQYIRVGFTFPEFLDDYLTPDQHYIANNIRLKP